MSESGNVSFYLIYIDESYDVTHYAYSAMLMPAHAWNAYFDHLITWRHDWFRQYNITPDKELHGTDFVAGRGQPHHNRNKSFRAGLFKEAIGRIEAIEGLQVMNAITSDKKKYPRLFEYMLNRLNRALEAQNAYGILICDEGKENKLTSMVRKMKKSQSYSLK